MATANVRVRYRPVRIGWCIRDNNWDDLRRALRLTHIFWGGRFNPVIPAGASSADELVRRFRVDVLVDIAEDATIKALMERFNHLPWPMFERGLFSHDHEPHFLDISHPVQKIAKEPQPEGILGLYSSRLALVQWQSNDPLTDILLATFGRYPTLDEIGVDYQKFVSTSLTTRDERIDPNGLIPADLLDQLTPSELCKIDLHWDRVPHANTMGVYVGSADDFQDVLNYWNLRASDLSVLFLDPIHSKRLDALKISHLEFIRQRQSSAARARNELGVWSRSQNLVQLAFPGESISSYWSINGTDVIQGDFRPLLQYFSDKSVLSSLSEKYGRRTLAFQLPEKPLIPEQFSVQRFVVSVRTPSEDRDDTQTFWTPYLPELNEWYGRNVRFSATAVRAETIGLAIICKVTDEHLALGSIPKQELAAKLFELAGIVAKPSLPGRIASRLISQLGGLQGCRVLKIRGVRRLIREHGPLQDFDRTQAKRTIGNSDPATGHPRFEDYEVLFIEQRDPAIKLKP